MVCGSLRYLVQVRFGLRMVLSLVLKENMVTKSVGTVYDINTMSTGFVTWLQNALRGIRLRGAFNTFCHQVAKCVTIDPHFVTFLTHFVVG